MYAPSVVFQRTQEALKCFGMSDLEGYLDPQKYVFKNMRGLNKESLIYCWAPSTDCCSTRAKSPFAGGCFSLEQR